MTWRVSTARVAWLGLGLAAAVVTWLTGARATADHARILVTPFTILFGVVSLQLSSLAAHPLYPGDWKIAKLHAEELRDFALRYVVLFYAYVASVGLLVLAALWGNCVFGRLVLCFAGGVFAASFGVPISIARHQLRLIEQKVEERLRESAEEFRVESRKSDGQGTTL